MNKSHVHEINRHQDRMIRLIEMAESPFKAVAGEVALSFNRQFFQALKKRLEGKTPNPVEALRSIRGDSILGNRLLSSGQKLRSKGVGVAADFMSKVYKENVKGRAKIWNKHTNAAVSIEPDITGAELMALVDLPLDGRPLYEWAVRHADSWQWSVKGSIGNAFTGERGKFESGLVLLNQRVGKAFDQWVKDMGEVLKLAGRRALTESNEAFTRDLTEGVVLVEGAA